MIKPAFTRQALRHTEVGTERAAIIKGKRAHMAIPAKAHAPPNYRGGKYARLEREKEAIKKGEWKKPR